jgi:hypothetical protein
MGRQKGKGNVTYQKLLGTKNENLRTERLEFRCSEGFLKGLDIIVKIQSGIKKKSRADVMHYLLEQELLFQNPGEIEDIDTVLKNI